MTLQETQDIRITRLENRMRTFEDVQTELLRALNTVIANQDKLKASQDELRASLNELKANQDELKANQDSLIGMVQMIIQELSDIKDRVSD